MASIVNRFWGRVLGVDLGTVNTVVVYDGKIVVSEPTVVVYDTAAGKIYFGTEALPMVGHKIKGLKVVWPMIEGRICDYEAIGYYLDYLLSKVIVTVLGWDLRGTQLLAVAIPCLLDSMYKREVLRAGKKKAHDVALIEQPAAAVFGEGIDLEKESSVLVYDIGGGTTDVTAVTKKGQIVQSSRTLNIAGNMFDQAIVEWVLEKYDVVIPQLFARSIKHSIGCAMLPNDPGAFVNFSGYNSKRAPVNVRITAREMPDILKDPLDACVSFGLDWFTDLGRNNPESLIRMNEGKSISGEQITREMIYLLLTGGGGILDKVDLRLSRGLGIPVQRAIDPLGAAAKGAAIIGMDPELLSRFRIPESEHIIKDGAVNRVEPLPDETGTLTHRRVGQSAARVQTKLA